MYKATDASLVERRLSILNDLERFGGNVSNLCRHYGISREIFNRWRRAHADKGKEGLQGKKPGPPKGKGPNMPPIEVEEKVLHLRRHYHFGQVRISWYLARYHGIKISPGDVGGIILRHGLNNLPRKKKTRSEKKPKLYEKREPGYYVQVDVKFLFFTDSKKRRVKRFQYTAIDDATRLRILKVYPRHTQKSSIDFINHIVDKFPFPIRQIRTDNGHEFQSQFHWHVLDLGIDHRYIKKDSPHLNGKVERSHRIDKEEFYPLIA